MKIKDEAIEIHNLEMAAQKLYPQSQYLRDQWIRIKLMYDPRPDGKKCRIGGGQIKQGVR